MLWAIGQVPTRASWDGPMIFWTLSVPCYLSWLLLHVQCTVHVCTPYHMISAHLHLLAVCAMYICTCCLVASSRWANLIGKKVFDWCFLECSCVCPVQVYMYMYDFVMHICTLHVYICTCCTAGYTDDSISSIQHYEREYFAKSKLFQWVVTCSQHVNVHVTVMIQQAGMAAILTRAAAQVQQNLHQIDRPSHITCYGRDVYFLIHWGCCKYLFF